jgi:hypothetical protein
VLCGAAALVGCHVECTAHCYKEGFLEGAMATLCCIYWRKGGKRLLTNVCGGKLKEFCEKVRIPGCEQVVKFLCSNLVGRILKDPTICKEYL